MAAALLNILLRPPNEAFAASSDKTIIITSMETNQILALRKLTGCVTPIFIRPLDDAQRDPAIAENRCRSA